MVLEPFATYLEGIFSYEGMKVGFHLDWFTIQTTFLILWSVCSYDIYPFFFVDTNVPAWPDVSCLSHHTKVDKPKRQRWKYSFAFGNNVPSYRGWHKRTNIKLLNGKVMTALDVAESSLGIVASHQGVSFCAFYCYKITDDYGHYNLQPKEGS